MSGNPRAIFDTNVLISSLLTNNSLPQQALDMIIDRGTLLFSQASLTDLAEVLAREKFDRYLSRERRARFVATLSKVAEIIAVTERFTDCRDPDDNKFLDLAVAGRADCIITGDPDLLALHPFRGIPVLTPRAFLVDPSITP